MHEDEVVEQGEVPKGVKLALWAAFLFVSAIGLLSWILYN